MIKTKVAQAPGTIVLKPLDGGGLVNLRREIIIGRSSSCDLVINRSFMSRQHAKLIPGQWEVTVEDLGSVNGTYVNDKKITGKVRAKHKDTVRFDTLVYEIRIAVDLGDIANIDNTKPPESTEPAPPSPISKNPSPSLIPSSSSIPVSTGMSKNGQSLAILPSVDTDDMATINDTCPQGVKVLDSANKPKTVSPSVTPKSSDVVDVDDYAIIDNSRPTVVFDSETTKFRDNGSRNKYTKKVGNENNQFNKRSDAESATTRRRPPPSSNISSNNGSRAIDSRSTIANRANTAGRNSSNINARRNVANTHLNNKRYNNSSSDFAPRARTSKSANTVQGNNGLFSRTNDKYNGSSYKGNQNIRRDSNNRAEASASFSATVKRSRVNNAANQVNNRGNLKNANINSTARRNNNLQATNRNYNSKNGAATTAARRNSNLAGTMQGASRNLNNRAQMSSTKKNKARVVTSVKGANQTTARKKSAVNSNLQTTSRNSKNANLNATRRAANGNSASSAKPTTKRVNNNANLNAKRANMKNLAATQVARQNAAGKVNASTMTKRANAGNTNMPVRKANNASVTTQRNNRNNPKAANTSRKVSSNAGAMTNNRAGKQRVANAATKIQTKTGGLDETNRNAKSKGQAEASVNWAIGHAKLAERASKEVKSEFKGQTVQIDTIQQDIDMDMPGAVLIGLSGEVKGRVFPLACNSNLTKWEVGRAESSDVMINDSSVSRNHAQIIHDDMRWKLIDLMSANGTHVNGNKSLTSYLESGDTVRFGSQEYLFKMTEGRIKKRRKRQGVAAWAMTAAAAVVGTGAMILGLFRE